MDKINKLLKQGARSIQMLEHYDRTRELLIGRKRIDITLDKN